MAVLYGSESVLVKIRDSLLCVMNHYMKVTNKVILASVLDLNNMSKLVLSSLYE